MRRKLLLVLSMVALLVLVLAFSVSADNSLKSQGTNAFGELSFFDESVTVGRTDSANGFTPYMKDGETYARVVVGDGTTFYTFPTYYIMEKNAYEGTAPLWQHNFTSLNSAMESATGTNPSWGIANVYRLELPYSMKYLNAAGSQKFDGYSNMIELTLAPDMTTAGTTNVYGLFRYCPNLEVIYNIDTFVFLKGCATDAFYNDEKLTSLTLCVSPDVVGTPSQIFYNCKALVSVNFVEAFPNITGVETNCFANCNALKSISSARSNDGVLVLPSAFTYIGNNAFQNCDSVKAVKFTGSSVKILQNSFNSMDSLEFVYFPRESTLNLPSCEVFSNNTNLKAVAFPDDCTLIPDRGFKNCTNLQAVYLPANLYELKTNGGGQGAFAYNNNMYFVQDWFSVLDENGEFLLDSFVQPTRPDVYYFPNTLTLFYNRDSGTGFDANYNLNPVMVLPTTVTKLWVYDGCFYDCGKTGNKFTIVCLGDMTDVRIGMRENRAKGISYIFANANDVDLSSITIVDTNAGYSPSLNGDESVFFCASDKYFTLYNLGGSNDATQYTNDNTTLVVDATKHLTSPRATKTTEATCTTIEGTTYYCFCEKLLKEEKTGDALGHLNSEVKDIAYNGATMFFENGDTTYYCERCKENHVVVGSASIIFVAKGYTYTEGNNPSKAIMQSFAVNREALDLYNQYTANTIEGYGLVAASTSTTEVFDNGVAGTNGAVASFKDKTYDIMEMKITGIEKNESYAQTALNCCAYILVKNGESVDSYYATEVLDSDLEGIQVSVTETLTGGASYDQIYGNRNPQAVE